MILRVLLLQVAKKPNCRSPQHLNLILNAAKPLHTSTCTYQHGSICIASTDRLDCDNGAVSAVYEPKADTLYFFQMFSTVTDERRANIPEL